MGERVATCNVHNKREIPILSVLPLPSFQSHLVHSLPFQGHRISREEEEERKDLSLLSRVARYTSPLAFLRCPFLFSVPIDCYLGGPCARQATTPRAYDDGNSSSSTGGIIFVLLVCLRVGSSIGLFSFVSL